MGLYVWSAEKEGAQDFIRKQYSREGKVKNSWPRTWKLERGYSNEEVSLTAIYEEIREIRDNDLAVCFGYDRPKDSEDKGCWRRNKNSLAGEEMQIVCFDFDGEDARVSYASSVSERLDAIKDLLPILRNVGLVAFYSSSALYEDKDRPHRINLHVMVKLDKPYKRETIQELLAAYECVDSALGVQTQPHIIANPIFNGIKPLQLKDPYIVIEEGKPLSLDGLNLPKKRNSWKNLADKEIRLLSEINEGYDERIRKHWLDKAESGALDGKRNKELWTAIFWANVNLLGRTEKVIKALSHPKIAGDHDLIDKDRRAKNLLYGKLFGSESGFTEGSDKIIRELNLANYDISDLPTEDCVILLKSGCGTGKTKGFIKRYVEQGGYESGLYVSVIKSTIEPAAKDIGFSYYLAGGEDPHDKKHWMQSQPFVATTDKSLSYLLRGGMYKPFDVVFIDESERVALEAVNHTSRQDVLRDICRAAKSVVFLDADITDDLTGWYAEEIAKDSSKELRRLVNTKDWMGEGHSVFFLKKEIDAYKQIENLVREGKKVYVHCSFSEGNERKRIRRFIRYLEKRFPDKKFEGYDAQSVPDELRNNSKGYIDGAIKEGLSVLMVSPWAKIGWDYNGEEEFDATVGIYPNRNLSGPDIMQALRRPRKTKLHYLWITQKKPKNWMEGYLEKTRNEFEGLKRLELSFAGRLGERARQRKQDMESAIPYHAKELAEQRGAFVHIGYECGIEGDWSDLEALLVPFAELEWSQEVERAWEDYKLRAEVNANFFEWERARAPEITTFAGTEEAPPNTEGLEHSISQAKWFKAAINPSREDFEELYSRYKYLTNKDGDLREIARIWFSSPAEREALDIGNDNRMAHLTGRLLDAVEKIVAGSSSTLKEPRLLNLLRSSEEDELFVCYQDSETEELKNLTKNFYHARLEETVPWMTGDAKGKPTTFFKQMARYWDLDIEEIKQGTKKAAEMKREMIRHYAEKGITAVKRTGTPRDGINAEMEKVNKEISRKIEEGETLSGMDLAWLPYQNKVFLITRRKYVNKKICEIIDSEEKNAF